MNGNVHIIRFNTSREFSDIEKMVRPTRAAKALGDAMGAAIGPQIKAMRAIVSAQRSPQIGAVV